MCEGGKEAATLTGWLPNGNWLEGEYQMAKKRRGGKRTVVMSVEKGGRRWE